jgi:uncharacterized membrane protein (DUF4010 family)
MLVLFFTGLSFAGYLARRTFGAGKGYPLAGLLGGLISSTNTTFTFARLSQHEKALSVPLAAGAVGACTMLFPRVLVAASVLNLPVARLLLPYLAVPFVIGAIALAFWWRKGTKGQAGHHQSPATRPRAADGAGLSAGAVRRRRGGPRVRQPRPARVGRRARADRRGRATFP